MRHWFELVDHLFDLYDLARECIESIREWRERKRGGK